MIRESMAIRGQIDPGLPEQPGKQAAPFAVPAPLLPRESCRSALLPTPRLLVETLQARSPPRPT